MKEEVREVGCFVGCGVGVGGCGLGGIRGSGDEGSFGSGEGGDGGTFDGEVVGCEGFGGGGGGGRSGEDDVVGGQSDVSSCGSVGRGGGGGGSGVGGGEGLNAERLGGLVLGANDGPQRLNDVKEIVNLPHSLVVLSLGSVKLNGASPVEL